MVSFDEASDILRCIAQPLRSVRCPIGEAAGLVTAEDLVAQLPAPRVDVSAMDGFAVREEDLPGPFRLAGVSRAGSADPPALRRAEAMRIFTGAMVPPGANRVLVQEIVEQRDGEISVSGEWGPKRHIRSAGSDFREGQLILPAGTRLTARHIVSAAAADHSEIVVWQRPRLAILATGDELVAPGCARATIASVPDSVGVGVAALAREWGAQVEAVKRARDDPELIAALSEDLLGPCDVLVTIGGASVGSRDFASASRVGGPFQTLFAKVAMRPGKPVACSADGRGRFVLNLPGNPTSALVAARLFLSPLLRVLAGGDYDEALAWKELILASPLPPSGPSERFARARATDEGVRPLADQQSSRQATLPLADFLVRQRQGSGALEADRPAPCLAF